MFLVGILLAIGLFLFPSEAPAPTGKYENERQFLYISGTFLRAIIDPCFVVQFVSLGDLIDGCNVSLLMNRIIQCESGWDSNVKNPYSTAYGLCQMLQSTRDRLEYKWGTKDENGKIIPMDIDWTDYNQQLCACQRLLSEEGTSHWLETEWCWNK